MGIGKKIVFADRLFRIAERIVQWLPATVSTAAVALASGWAVYVTEALGKYAPASWITSALAGGIVAAVCFWLWANASERLQQVKVSKLWAERPMLVNPLDDIFNRQTMDLSTFFNNYRKPSDDKIFNECVLRGPALVIFLERVSLTDNNFQQCDFVKVPLNPTVENAVMFRRFSAARCTFVGVTFLIQENLVSQFPKGTPWIN